MPVLSTTGGVEFDKRKIVLWFASEFAIEIRGFSTHLWEAFRGLTQGGLDEHEQRAPTPAADPGGEVGGVRGGDPGRRGAQVGVDVSVVIKLRRLVKDAALAAFAASRPRRVASPQEVEIEALRADNARLSEALKELAVELTLMRGKARLA
jgi:hypothetical protein